MNETAPWSLTSLGASCEPPPYVEPHAACLTPSPEYVARVDRLPEVDDCAVALVLSCAKGSQSTRTST